MRKTFFFAFCLVGLLLISKTFAGDAASFVDIGFSKDGNTYAFGQYGKTDKDYCGFCDVFFVDVANNVYLQNGIFGTSPSFATKSKSGYEVFCNLEEKIQWKMREYAFSPCDSEQTLYIMEDESKASTSPITFADFKNSTVEAPQTYKVVLQPQYNGFGTSSYSSFVIDLQKTAKDGTVLFSKKVGTPTMKRKGVINYRIIKIMTSKQGKGLVFVVEKTIETANGKNIRYMVETCTNY